MSGVCRICGHGKSWHEELELYESAFINTKPSWRSKKIPCQKEGCTCNYYERIKKYDLPIMQSGWGNWSPSQIAQNEQLKLAREPAIVIDKDFHEMFCTVLKEETNRTCDCEGTTSEIRAGKKL